MNNNVEAKNEIDFQKIYFPGKLVILTNELFNKQKVAAHVIIKIQFK